ncbi:MAG: molybdate ABC transporter permease subunit [Bacteroidota bacterium]|nr:molybdate ABC transporter permease subunit [Candidatus Kapabacteria bacterium]MDW8220834.1 molybdate ABC transporter permease subunit [Bacteroidota bacterium]
MSVFEALLVSLRLGVSTVGILLVCGIPVAYYLAYSSHRFKPLWEIVVTIPIVLPPTVIGFYWLYVFGRASALGIWLHNTLSVDLVFSFAGVALGSSLYCLPFMVQPLKAGFEAVSKELLDSAVLEGASSLQILWYIMLPLARKHLLAGCTLVFVHALGEFGVVMMIGGNIDGETRTLSIALYDAVQALEFQYAHTIALLLVVLVIVCLVPMFWYFRERYEK